MRSSVLARWTASLLFCVVFLSVDSVYSTSGPLLLSACPAPTVPVGASVFFHDRTCQTLFVGPPRRGKVRVDRFLPAAIPHQCAVFDQVLTGFKKAVDIAARALESPGTDHPQGGATTDLPMETCRRAEAAIKSKEATATKLENDIQTIIKEREALSQQLLALTRGEAPPSVLEVLAREFPAFQAAARSKRAELELLGRDLVPLRLWFDNSGCQQRLNHTAEPGDSNRDHHAIATLERAGAAYMGYLQRNSRVAGATGVLEISVGFAEHVSEWQRLNPGSKVVPLPVQMTIAGGSSFFDGTLFPALLKGQIVGLRDTSGQIKLGNSLAAEVVLNLPAACSALRHGHDRTGLGEALEEGSMGLSALVNFPVLVGTSYTVKVDHGALYQRLRKESATGGFFRTKRMVRVTDINKSDEVISVRFSTTDLAEDQKRDTIEAVKNAVIQRAFDLIDARYVPENDLTLTLDKRDPAAPEAAEALRTRCANPWCQAGAVLIDLSHAVFGGETQLQEFMRRRNVVVVEEYDSSRPVIRYTTISFGTER